MKQQILYAFLLVSILGACQSKKQEDTTEQVINQPVPYDLTKPDQRYDLPRDLREISGLSYFKPGMLACIQDELAVVFLYDLKKKKVADEVVFGSKGDYEGVEYVNEELFALRSDGEIYHFPAQPMGSKYVAHIKVGLPGKNDVEGLGYDPKLNALLLAVKDGKGSDKPIYYYDLKHGTLFQGPVIKQDELKAFEKATNTAGAKEHADHEVKPAGIAVHPKSGDYYVLASNGHRLLVLNRKGKFLSSVPLNPELFKQPEGICFAPDGTLYIASEGGYLLTFNMIP